jgi:hypothetical protein
MRRIIVSCNWSPLSFLIFINELRGKSPSYLPEFHLPAGHDQQLHVLITGVADCCRLLMHGREEHSVAGVRFEGDVHVLLDHVQVRVEVPRIEVPELLPLSGGGIERPFCRFGESHVDWDPAALRDEKTQPRNVFPRPGEELVTSAGPCGDA